MKIRPARPKTASASTRSWSPRRGSPARRSAGRWSWSTSSFDQPEKGDYIVHVLEEPDSGNRSGLRLLRPDADDRGVYDLYWIAVDPKQQGQGLGQVLLRFVENEVRRQRGRMLLIETSSKRSYGRRSGSISARAIEEISRIKDFYRIEDDKVVFCKNLAQ